MLAALLVSLAGAACSVKREPGDLTGAPLPVAAPSPPKMGAAGATARGGAGGRASQGGAGRAPSMPVALFEDGDACTAGEDCASGYCDQGLCCTGGRCCMSDAQCAPAAGGTSICSDRRTCQGTRSAGICENFRCETMDDMPDDSGCGRDVIADECGPYRARMCTGASTQTAPACPTGCMRDDECDPEAHCGMGRCVMDAENGGACKADTECKSGHCGNGHCCANGECCAAAADCPGKVAPRCDRPMDCQGTRTDATCVDFQCNVMQVEDDSACGPATRARECGTGRDAVCNGQADQKQVACDSHCQNNDDSQCDPSAHCAQGDCIIDSPNGSPCGEDSDCQSGHCGDAVCCAGGQCCVSDAPCGAGRCNDRTYTCEAAPPAPPRAGSGGGMDMP